MIQKDYNDFYLKTTVLDRLIYTICVLLTFNNPETFTDIKNYLNRRILLKLLKDTEQNLVYIEKFRTTIRFSLSGYIIDYNCTSSTILLLCGNILFIQGHDYGDTKIVKEIIAILNKKYHEHQENLLKVFKESED